jgi:hypothetical protein
MTFNELVAETRLLYEEISSSSAPGFLSEEWGQFFTIAQRKVVVKILEEGINKNAFNQVAIEKLVKANTYNVIIADTHFKDVNGVTAAQAIDISPDPLKYQFFWVLDEYVKTSANKNIPIKRITYDFYRTNLKNPFRVPDEDEGYWALQYNNILVFITDGTTITGYQVVGVEHPDTYPIVSGVVYPAGGTQASCLNPSVHPRIVEEAVTLARMSVTDTQGYQLAMAEFNK